MIDAYATERQYAEHIAPVWSALDERGNFFATRLARPWLESQGIEVAADRPQGHRNPIIVASYQDLRSAPGRDIVFVEHGAGQTYCGEGADNHPSYSGGTDRDAVKLFVCPSQTVADRNRAQYPNAQVAVVGEPKLDRWRGRDHGDAVCVSFHADLHLVPETRWAYPHYVDALAELAKLLPLIGHAHPRVFDRLAPIYREMGIEPVATFDEVLERSRVYVCDNSSTLYQFAALDRPVVVLDAPWYRREVNHGLRFWSEADVGVRISDPRHLPQAVAQALADGPCEADMRRKVIERVYAFSDNRAAQRAVAAIRAAGLRPRRDVVDPYKPQVPVEPVPGNAAELLEWVEADPAKAQRALEAERLRERPRPGVLRVLEALR
jgi:CDP-glycerol:poly(glycerophosphate) glycerophosphotransferase